MCAAFIYSYAAYCTYLCSDLWQCFPLVAPSFLFFCSHNFHASLSSATFPSGYFVFPAVPHLVEHSAFLFISLPVVCISWYTSLFCSLGLSHTSLRPVSWHVPFKADTCTVYTCNVYLVDISNLSCICLYAINLVFLHILGLAEIHGSDMVSVRTHTAVLQKHLVKIALTTLHFEPMKTQLSSVPVSLANFSLVPPTFYLLQIF